MGLIFVDEITENKVLFFLDKVQSKFSCLNEEK